jgi:hypothetical protein
MESEITFSVMQIRHCIVVFNNVARVSTSTFFVTGVEKLHLQASFFLPIKTADSSISSCYYALKSD